MSEPIEQIIDSVDWRSVDRRPQKNEEDLPYVTHEGVMCIGDIEFKVYRLSSGEAVIDADDMQNHFGTLLEGLTRI